MSTAAGAPPEVDRVAHRLMRCLPGAHLVGAVVVLAYLIWLPPPGGRSTLSESDLVINAAVFASYLAVAFPFGRRLHDRLAERAAGWLKEERAPTQDEARATLNLPWRFAVTSFALWLGAAALFAPLNLAFDRTGFQSARVCLGIILAGLTTSALAFLLAERTMRPAFALALANGRPPGARRLRLGPKLVLLWALGSGVPLLAIALSPLGLGPRGRAELIGPVVGIAVLGVVVGFAMSLVAARMLSEPLEQLREAVIRVENEDLDVEVLVDDAGTLGYLQTGFNRLVAGLRERRRLEDLFGRHVGVDVARLAVQNGVNLEGERREVSVIFVDLIGSTALAQREGADRVVGTLNAFFDVVVEVVTAAGGWVNKFEGDGALCVFGAPADQPDHAVRALRAARTLHRELLALGAAQPELDAAIGISSGLVVAGNIGAAQRYEYTVIGDPVNEAARLTEEAKARLGRVLASEETLARAMLAAGMGSPPTGEGRGWGSGRDGEAAANSPGEGQSWSPAGELKLRGRSVPTIAYEPGPALRDDKEREREPGAAQLGGG